ncbi:MAG: pilin [Candidatus Saccharibacteria bacterium]
MKKVLQLSVAVICILLAVGFASFNLPHAKAAIPAGCPGGPAGPPAPGTDCTSGTYNPPGSATSSKTDSQNQQFVGTCRELRDAGTINATGFVAFLCPNDAAGNAVEVIVGNITNYIVGLGTFVLILIVAIAGVQIMTGGASPEAIKAGKRRMTMALSSIALLVMGRVVLQLIGITSGSFLGVPVSTGFNKDTIPAIISAITQYVFFAGGVLSIAMIIYGGFVMITSAGNPQRIQSARRVIMYAVIGLAVMVSAGLIVGLVGRALTG